MNKNMKKPNFFQVGFPKSGTTVLHDYLSQHPSIFMSIRKEPLYFCKDFFEEAFKRSKHCLYRFNFRTEEDYLALFKDATNEKVIGESSSPYSYSKVAAQEIYRFNPKAKILVGIREPVSFLWSYHSQCIKHSTETELNFENALKLESSRRLGRNIPPNAYAPSFLFYSDRIKYTKQINRYLNLFGSENVKVFIFEEFKKNNLEVYCEVLEFLEVDTSFEPDLKQLNISSKPRLNFINSLAFNPKFKSFLRKSFPPLILDNSIIINAAKKILWKKDINKKMNPELKLSLMKQFRPEVEKLSSVLKIDLVKYWGYEQI